MKTDRQTWQAWAEKLRQFGAVEIAATLLEAFGPLTLLGAQAVYLSQPILKPLAPEGHLEALANMLEDSKERQAFVQFLREANPQ